MRINALQTSTKELLEEILEEIHNSSSGKTITIFFPMYNTFNSET